MRVDVVEYLTTVLSVPLSSPAVASSSAPVSPTSVKPLCAKSSVTPLSGDLERASAICWRFSEMEGKGE